MSRSASEEVFAVGFSRRLQVAANAVDMTHYKVAVSIGGRWGASIPTTRVKQYFNGEKLPNTKALRDLCDVLGVSADWLIYGDSAIRLMHGYGAST